MKEDIYSYEGLLVLIDCLNELIDGSGKRQQMINTSKEKVMASYDIAKNFLPVEVINDQLKVTNQKIFRLKVAGKCTRSSGQTKRRRKKRLETEMKKNEWSKKGNNKRKTKEEEKMKKGNATNQINFF